MRVWCARQWQLGGSWRQLALGRWAHDACAPSCSRRHGPANAHIAGPDNQRGCAGGLACGGARAEGGAGGGNEGGLHAGRSIGSGQGFGCSGKCETGLVCIPLSGFLECTVSMAAPLRQAEAGSYPGRPLNGRRLLHDQTKPGRHRAAAKPTPPALPPLHCLHKRRLALQYLPPGAHSPPSRWQQSAGSGRVPVC